MSAKHNIITDERKRYQRVKQSVISLLTACLLAVTTSIAAAPGFSEINNVLFDSAHLDNIAQPGVITYQYSKESIVEDAREDTIKVNVSNIRNTGRRDLAFNFLPAHINDLMKPWKTSEVTACSYSILSLTYTK
jgi:hypothetical protein